MRDAGHRLRAVRRDGGAAQALAYDAQGRATQIGPDRLVWDALGRLAAVTDASGTVREAYVWDAAGRLAEARRPNGERERFAYDGAHKVAAIDAQGAALWEATWGPGARPARRAAHRRGRARGAHRQAPRSGRALRRADRPARRAHRVGAARRGTPVH